MIEAKKSDFSDQLDKLETNRSVLQGLLESASSLESLREGLETSLQLGQSSKSLPMEALQLYRDLSDKIKSLSDRDVLLMLRGLDKKVRIQLEAIIPLINFIVTVGADSNDEITEQISGFHQLTKTAVTLRVLLYKRGTDAPTLQIEIPELELRNKLTVIEKREQQYRREVGEAITQVEADVSTLLNSPACPQAMRQTLETTLSDLKRARTHLDAGLSIKELPISIELIEFPAASALPEPELEPAPLTNTEVNTPVEQEPATTVDEIDTATHEPKPQTSWWHKVRRWLTTPWSVKWGDIDDKR